MDEILWCDHSNESSLLLFFSICKTDILNICQIITLTSDFLRVKESVTAVPTNDKFPMLRKSKIILKFNIIAFLEANYDLLDWFLMVLTLGVFVGMVAYLKDS